MAIVNMLPGTKDRETIAHALHVYLKSDDGLVRDVMLDTIYYTLKKLGMRAWRQDKYLFKVTPDQCLLVKRKGEPILCHESSERILSRDPRLS